MSASEQLSLFPCGLEMRGAEAIKIRIMSATLAHNTITNYRSAWKSFERWCREAARESLPASPATCIDHAAWCIAKGLRLETAHYRLKAINHYHRENGLALPCDAQVSQFMRNARREIRERPQGKLALTPPHLRQICGRLYRRASVLDIRDRALILVCFACGWRRSEIVSLDLADVRFVPNGMVLWLAKSKTDQEGRGRAVGVDCGRRIVTCPVQALQQWLEVRGGWPGPLFTGFDGRRQVTRRRLGSAAVWRAVKAGLELIGEDPQPFGAHSLRAGMITAAAENGASETAIMQRTGHHCYEMIRRYVRPVQAFRLNPLKGVL